MIAQLVQICRHTILLKN